MFDGVLNSGLYITDHLQHGLQSKLPIHALTITAWFTISEATLNAGSLIAVQQEEGHCHKEGNCPRNSVSRTKERP